MPSQFTVYRSTDVGAPVLDGQPGSLIGVLDACLVNGYGARPAAGWSKAFSGVNKAAYRMGGGARLYLRVDDSTYGYMGTTSGYIGMSDVDTGTYPFYSSGGIAGSPAGHLHKSSAANTTPRSWTLFADARTAYAFVNTGNTTAYGVLTPWGFGEFDSFVAGDAYNVMICPAFNSTLNHSGFQTALLGACGYYGNVGNYYLSPGNELHTAGTIAQAAGSTFACFLPASGLIQRYAGLSGSYPNYLPSSGHVAYPNAADGGLYVCRKLIAHSVANPGAYNATFHLRGQMRGLWIPLHLVAALSGGTTFSGAGTEAGRTFELVGPVHCTATAQSYSALYTTGFIAIETSNTLS